VQTDSASAAIGSTLDVVHHLVEDVGAEWHEVAGDDPARTLVAFARDHQITQIVLGSTRRSRFEELTRGSVVSRVLRFAADEGIDVHIIGRKDPDEHLREAAPGD